MGQLLYILVLTLNLFFASTTNAKIDHIPKPVIQNKIVLLSNSRVQEQLIKSPFSTNYFTTEKNEFYITPSGDNNPQWKILENFLNPFQVNDHLTLLFRDPTRKVYPYEYLYPEKYIYFIQKLII